MNFARTRGKKMKKNHWTKWQTLINVKMDVKINLAKTRGELDSFYNLRSKNNVL